ncbi:MAG TPA: hypothetical protein VLE69_01060 [Candidatus Saccharimonadales bacterium]|nr:hypothetical protein [Candidatus Saccharimonadales bacterium]
MAIRGLLRQIKSRIPRRKTLLLVLLLVICVGVVCLGLFKVLADKSTPEDKVKNTYHQHLSTLQGDINTLPGFLSKSDTTAGDMDEYDKLMGNLIGDCNRIGPEYTHDKSLAVSQKLKDAMGNTDRLCSDLINVAQYSQNLYRATRAYMLLDNTSWPEAGKSDFQNRLDLTEQSIGISTTRMKEIDNTKVQDPALNELQTEINTSAGLVQQIKTALAAHDDTKVNTLAAQLLNHTNQDKHNFLNARIYFWNNTIQLTSLQKAISKLQDSFAPQKK